MKSVLISIQPKWCELIASGKKTIEVRKTKPKLDTPFKVYIYCTSNKNGVKDLLEIHGTDGKIRKANGKVIGEFVCDELTGGFWISPFTDYLQRQSCLSYDEVCDYANGKPIFAWHISDIVIYDKPRELSEFIRFCDTPFQCDRCNSLVENFGCGNTITRPPQSWCYVESEGTE